MKKQLIFLVCLCSPFALLFGQDSLWAGHQNKSVFIRHYVSNGETLFMLSRRFYAPVARTADMNGVNYQTGLATGSLFRIPVGEYNYVRINSEVASRPIYMKVMPGESLRSISRLFNVAQSAIQRWNHLDVPAVRSGQIIQVGWVKYDERQQPFRDINHSTAALSPEKNVMVPRRPVKKSGLPLRADSSAKKADSVRAGRYERLFHTRAKTHALTEEAGAAVFFPLKNTVDKSTYYALHDNAARGTIISVYNPANKSVVYAKVIGPLPKINKYHGAIIGLSNNAAAALRARDKKMFCKIKY